jgi:phage portal protein BeeE
LKRSVDPFLSGQDSLEQFVAMIGASRYAAGTYSPDQAYALSPYVAPSVHAFAAVVAARTFQVNKGTKPLERHPLLNLIARPNADLRTSEYDLLYYTAALQRHAGEVFWECEYEKAGMDRERGVKALPSKIWIWHKDAVTEVRDMRTREFLGWYCTWEGARHFVDKLDMLHFPNYDPTKHNPKGPARGTSVWQAKRLPLTNEIAASQWNRDWFSRGIAPSVVFVNKTGDVDDEDEFREKLKARLAGKNGEPIAITGDWVVQQLQASQKDAEFTEGQNLNRKAILAGITPPIVLGDNEANYANASAQIKAWLTFGVIPAMTALCSRLDVAFLYEQPELWTNLSTDDIDELQADKQSRITAYTALINARHSPKVAAEIVGLNVDPDMPGYEDVFLSFSQIPYEYAEGGQSVSISKADVPDDPVAGGDGGGITVAPPPVATTQPAAVEDKGQRTIRVRVDTPAPPASTRILVPVRTRAAEDGDILSVLLKIVEKDIKKLKDKSRQYQLLAVEAGSQQIGQSLGLDALVAVDDPSVVEFLEQRGNLITSVPEGVAERISDKCVAMIDEGASPEEIGAALRQDYNILSDRKAREIGRNEVGSGLNGGRHIQMEVEGIGSREWLSSRDTQVRDSHISLDGEVVGMDEKFSNGCRWPQDPDADADEVINCRCIEMPVIGGERGARHLAHMRIIAAREIADAKAEAARHVAALLASVEKSGRKRSALTAAEQARIAVLQESGEIDERTGYWRAVVRAKNIRKIEQEMSRAMGGIINGWRAPILKKLAEMGVAK